MRLLKFFLFLFMFVVSGNVFAHHGPDATCTCGTSVAKQGANLGQERWFASYAYNRTTYEDLSDQELRENTLKIAEREEHAHFHAIDWSSLHTVEIGFKATERWFFSASTGWFHGENTREGHTHHDGSYGLHRQGDVDGMTDLWLQTRYSLAVSELHPALIAGIKFPTGKDDAQFSDSTSLPEVSSRPSSGAYDYLLGAAVSGSVNETWSWEGHAQYVLKTEHDAVKIGDVMELGGGLWMALPESLLALGVDSWISKRMEDEEEGEEEKDSGGTSCFVAPSVRFSPMEAFSLAFSFALPLSQDLNGVQQGVDSVSKLSLQWGW